MFQWKAGLVRIKEVCNGREWRETKQRLFLTGRDAKTSCTLPLKNNSSVKYILNVHFFLMESIIVKPLKNRNVEVYFVQ